jgi:outer membrane protein insertion porin family
VLGGNRKVLVNAEILFPMPGAGQDKSLRLAWFVDGGQVYGVDQRVDLNELRFAAGIGLAWSSPVGPLRLSYGRPLNDKPGDRTERIQFTFGTMF